MVKYLDNNSGFNMWNANRAVNTNAKPKSRIGTFLWWGILFIGTWWLFSMWNAPKNVPVPTDTENAIIATDVSNVPAHEVSSDKITANVQGLRVSTVALTDFAADATADSDHVTLLGNDGDYIEVGMIATG
ncbi:MAG: hypothetical protein IKM94_02420, partial [Alphaproteobacteria bacterium]|nr:hypothetical protein [Alphaproteobacteria bacterium]